MRIKLAITACAAALLLLLAGCGGGTKGASPEKWVSAFCGSLATWGQMVKADAQQIKARLPKTGSSPSANRLITLRKQFVSFLDRTVTETKATQKAIREVGPPGVKNGDKIQDAVTKSLESIVIALKTLTAKARALPVSDPSAFVSQVNALGNSLQSSANGLSVAAAALQKYSTPALDKAGSADKSCKALYGG